MFNVYKPIGISCVDIIKELQQQDKYKNCRIAFSGRLDEMAHGNIIILINEETKKMAHYHNLNKKYKFKFIIGLETDTTATLGIFTNKKTTNIINESDICQSIENSKNTEFMQEYHIFSSFCPKHTSIKKPLWWWSLYNRLNEINYTPQKKVKIYDIHINNIKNITLKDFIEELLTNLSKLKKGIFRQEEIIEQWKKYYDSMKNTNTNFVEFECNIDVSSGFYVRQFVKDIGKNLNINVLVTEIERLTYF